MVECSQILLLPACFAVSFRVFLSVRKSRDCVFKREPCPKMESIWNLLEMCPKQPNWEGKCSRHAGNLSQSCDTRSLCSLLGQISFFDAKS